MTPEDDPFSPSDPPSSPALFPGLGALKEEIFTRIDLVVEVERLVVKKHYKTNPWLAWRTLGHPSRACREFRNLGRLRLLGVPCVEALSWSERRGRFFQVRDCVLRTGYLSDSRDLRSFFKTTSAGVPEARRHRRAVARALGDLLRGMHRAGALHLRSASRNFIVYGEKSSPRVVLLDVPYMVFARRALDGTWWAGLDLFDALFSLHRRQEMSGPERLAALEAYCQGDRALIRRYWSRLKGRSYRGNRLLKALAIVVFKSLSWIGRSKRFGREPGQAGTAALRGASW